MGYGSARDNYQNNVIAAAGGSGGGSVGPSG